MFQKLFNNNNIPISNNIFGISEDNLNAIQILINNCYKEHENNNDISIASVSPNLWLAELLNKYYKNISYVTNSIRFEIVKKSDTKDELITRTYIIENKTLSEEELEQLLQLGEYKTYVVYSIKKIVNLIKLTSHYEIRYTDITEPHKIRDGKINQIIK